jgi:hypothetical protein
MCLGFGGVLTGKEYVPKFPPKRKQVDTHTVTERTGFFLGLESV